jgi:hypothetical protein
VTQKFYVGRLARTGSNPIQALTGAGCSVKHVQQLLKESDTKIACALISTKALC